jgi:hypothetical protein
MHFPILMASSEVKRKDQVNMYGKQIWRHTFFFFFFLFLGYDRLRGPCP